MMYAYSTFPTNNTISTFSKNSTDIRKTRQESINIVGREKEEKERI